MDIAPNLRPFYTNLKSYTILQSLPEETHKHFNSNIFTVGDTKNLLIFSVDSFFFVFDFQLIWNAVHEGVQVLKFKV